MVSDNWKDFIFESKIIYKNIGHIRCPAFNFDPIYFGREGFNHLIRKGSVFRNRLEQRRRLILINKVIEIVSTHNKYDKYREETIIKNNNISRAYFWSLISKGVAVIIRKVNNGRKHFFSVIPNRKIKTPEGV